MSQPSSNRTTDSRRARDRFLVIAASVAGHALVLFALLGFQTDAPKPGDPGPMTVALVDGPRLFPQATPLASASPAPPKSAPRQTNARRSPAPPEPDSLAAGEAKTLKASAELSDAQIAGAASADSGPSGGACDIARRLQSALRKDALVQSVAARSPGKALMVWNGDWVRSGGEDGKGLAAVREAILWEIGFAPAACRSQPVHGLILLSLNEGPGAARLAVGASDWRWSDLLAPTPAFIEAGSSARRGS